MGILENSLGEVLWREVKKSYGLQKISEVSHSMYVAACQFLGLQVFWLCSYMHLCVVAKK